MQNIATKQSILAAWDKAADCAALAKEAGSQESRKMYEQLRNSWIQVANNLEIIAEATELRRNDQMINLLDGGVSVQERRRN